MESHILRLQLTVKILKNKKFMLELQQTAYHNPLAKTVNRLLGPEKDAWYQALELAVSLPPGDESGRIFEVNDSLRKILVSHPELEEALLEHFKLIPSNSKQVLPNIQFSIDPADIDNTEEATLEPISSSTSYLKNNLRDSTDKNETELKTFTNTQLLQTPSRTVNSTQTKAFITARTPTRNKDFLLLNPEKFKANKKEQLRYIDDLKRIFDEKFDALSALIIDINERTQKFHPTKQQEAKNAAIHLERSLLQYKKDFRDAALDGIKSNIAAMDGLTQPSLNQLTNVNNMFNDLINEKLSDFKSNCNRAIEEAKPILEKHRGWGALLNKISETINQKIIKPLSKFMSLSLFKISKTKTAKKVEKLNNYVNDFNLSDNVHVPKTGKNIK